LTAAKEIVLVLAINPQPSREHSAPFFARMAPKGSQTLREKKVPGEMPEDLPVKVKRTNRRVIHNTV
jgi:hypothetical protein